MALPELTPIAEKPKEVERQLLTQIATEANTESWKDLRWYVIGGNTPRAIIVCKRGKKPERVQTISKGTNPEAWTRWQPVLAEWLSERDKTGKRVNHEKLQNSPL